MKRIQHGLSLVELVAVLALTGVLAALALPDMAAMLRSHRLNTAVADLFGAVDLTRSHAIARGRRVLLVPLEPGGRNWRDGWVVLVDENGDRRPSPGEEVIASRAALPDGIAINVRFTSKATPDYVAYGPSGRSCSDTSSMVARWGTISLRQEDDIRRIKINMLGRARMCRPDRDGTSCPGED